MQISTMREKLGLAFLGADAAVKFFGCHLGPEEFRDSLRVSFMRDVVEHYSATALAVAVMPVSIHEIAKKYRDHFDETFDKNHPFAQIKAGCFRSVSWHLVARQPLSFREGCNGIGLASERRCIESVTVMVYAAILFKELHGCYPFEEGTVYSCSDRHPLGGRVGISFNGKIRFSSEEKPERYAFSAIA